MAATGQEQKPNGQPSMWNASWQAYVQKGAAGSEPQPQPQQPSVIDAATGQIKTAVKTYLDEQIKAGGDALAQGFTAYSNGAVITMAQAEAERRAAERVPLNVRIIAVAQQLHDASEKAKPILAIAGGVLSSLLGSRHSTAEQARGNGNSANGPVSEQHDANGPDGFPDWYVSPEPPTRPAGFLGPVNADEVIIDGEYTES